MDTSAERNVALEVERQLVALSVEAHILTELPIAPLRGVEDLVRLELALTRFAAAHRSRRSKILIDGVRTLLRDARRKLHADRSVTAGQLLASVPRTRVGLRETSARVLGNTA